MSLYLIPCLSVKKEGVKLPNSLIRVRGLVAGNQHEKEMSKSTEKNLIIWLVSQFQATRQPKRAQNLNFQTVVPNYLTFSEIPNYNPHSPLTIPNPVHTPRPPPPPPRSIQHVTPSMALFNSEHQIVQQTIFNKCCVHLYKNMQSFDLCIEKPPGQNGAVRVKD